MSWSEFLQWASSPGINVIVGALLSVLIEYAPKYNDLEPKWKRLVFFGLSMVVPVGATALAVATGEWGTWGDFQGTWWPAIVAGATAGAAGTVAHTRKVKPCNA